MPQRVMDTWRRLHHHPRIRRLLERWLPAIALRLQADPLLLAAAVLGGFSVAGIGLVGLTQWLTAGQIAAAERQILLDSLGQLVPAGSYDNDLLGDTVTVDAPELGPEPVLVYRARSGGQPVTAIFTTVAPDGYNGAIRLLVAVRVDGRLTGVRVVSHKETPGLGDGVEVQRSDWILQFDGKSLGDPPPERWKVRRDGGAFDQFTGATITPRAVVRAVRRTLEYFGEHRESLFANHSGRALHQDQPGLFDCRG